MPDVLAHRFVRIRSRSKTDSAPRSPPVAVVLAGLGRTVGLGRRNSSRTLVRVFQGREFLAYFGDAATLWRPCHRRCIFSFSLPLFLVRRLREISIRVCFRRVCYFFFFRATCVMAGNRGSRNRRQRSGYCVRKNWLRVIELQCSIGGWSVANDISLLSLLRRRRRRCVCMWCIK